MWWLLLFSTAATLAVVGCGSDRQEEKKKPSSAAVKKGPSAGSSTKTARSGKSGSKKRTSSKTTRKPGSEKTSKTMKKACGGSKKSSKKGSKSAKKTLSNSISKSAESAPLTAPLIVQAVEIHAQPTELIFAGHGGLQTFRFVNSSTQRRVFKVKCSDNQLYRVTPVYGFVEAMSEVKIDVLRQNGSAKVDKLVLMTAPMSTTTKSPKEQMAETNNCQMTVVPLLVDV